MGYHRHQNDDRIEKWETREGFALEWWALSIRHRHGRSKEEPYGRSLLERII